MADKMLIDASHEEETRVVVVRGNRIEEFDFESQHKKQLRGNIYLAKVTRVEPSLQAAFVDYGGNRHGFLAFSEIHPDYYQIPLADRQALLAEEAANASAEDDADDDETSADPANADLATVDQPDVSIEAAEAEPEAMEEKPKPKRKRRKPKAKETEEVAAASDADAQAAVEGDNAAVESTPEETAGDDDSEGGVMAAEVDADVISEDAEPVKNRKRGRRRRDDDDDDDSDEVESVGAEDAMEEVPEHVSRKPRKQYRIQEVIKRRQILLVQVAKEERGNKGAALTTYLSLAGRYSVLMPNTARGGGISRKITNPADRKRLKEVARGLEVPQGMGVILRTAGANRTKVEIKRDFEYLMRLWENVRTLTLNSTAPCLVYEEGSLIKRSIRDLYNKDISEIVVAGEDGYREAKDFMKMLMPSHAKVVQPYRDVHPIFSRSGIEAQLDRMLQPQVTLKSGGYLIINQTEALVAIDVNSGRSTREHSIEETALATNLEAAEEVARQLRLRDLAGLVVIDFIDMEEKRNNRAVEKRLKDHLKDDRARIQVGRISHFGLLEMSRQRIRASVLESTMQVCAHCGGTGHVRSQSSVALHVLRGIEEFLLKSTTHNISVRVSPETALYLLNYKRDTIVDYEARFGVSIIIEADADLGNQLFAIDRGEAVENPVKIEALTNFAVEIEDDPPVEEETAEEESSEEEERDGRKRRRRRRRRGRKGGDREMQVDADDAEEGESTEDDGDADGDSEGEDGAEAAADGDADGARRKRRRRGKRGGRRNRLNEEGANEGEGSDESADHADAAQAEEGAAEEPVEVQQAAAAVEGEAAEAPVEAVAVEAAEEAPVEADAKPKRKRRTPKAKKEAAAETQDDVVAEAPAEEPVAPAVEAANISEAADTAESVEDEPAKAPSRTSRTSSASGPIATDPVLTSTKEGSEKSEDKPKKGGWWQRRGFF